MDHPHPHTALCDVGRKLYTSALRTSPLSREATGSAPCLIDTGLLRHDPADPQFLVPAPPSEAVADLVRPLERELSEYRRFAGALAGTVEQLTARTPEEAAPSLLTLWKGKDQIEAALLRALDEGTEEFLATQPASGRTNRTAEKIHATAQRVRELHDRGISQRTLYNHTYRHPGLVWYLVSVFKLCWQFAVPWERQVPYANTPTGITGVQKKIARLLVEGRLDEAIARRLGMNVRTCRAHVARLATTLGSTNRAQLGYLIARSGILEEV
ncbi:helix-turn-helix transcriptional regulator [Streptomyces sp. WAC 06738]|uniref:helix-turn-helix transcriptional regulator n=1 Tax=Streptomyces sp. WAC 06738 TaxID=2203210 RepID=UPI000F6B4241|nr:helix-turn-helix transcriptional regulator [Streptomyces sp. WAC 06738]AZM47521.1 helix-turn-helix transcriptional regulator [Streptomyces sp. WAC 06738]